MINRQGNAEFWLVDLGSANGTRLNGRRVSQPCRLQDQDRLEVADFTFTFRQPTRVPRQRSQDMSATIQEIRSFNCWLLLADMVDSTNILARLQSEEAVNLTGRWLERCKRIIERYHGTVNKFLGDGFLAYWPEKPGVAADIAGALKELRVVQEAAQPAFRVILHYGSATAGGAPSLGEESLAGPEVTFAFRMEQLASVLGAALLLSEAAAQSLKPFLELSPVGRHTIEGREQTFGFFTMA
jgi:adenylate cyclase